MQLELHVSHATIKGPPYNSYWLHIHAEFVSIGEATSIVGRKHETTAVTWSVQVLLRTQETVRDFFCLHSNPCSAVEDVQLQVGRSYREFLRVYGCLFFTWRQQCSSGLGISEVIKNILSWISSQLEQLPPNWLGFLPCFYNKDSVLYSIAFM